MNDNIFLMLVAASFFIFGAMVGVFTEESGIEKKCIYENRVEFSGQMFSCQWLPGVTTTDKQYSVKPHPNKEALK